jgi:ParB/RepB/Spo0J family partition protein
MDTQVILTESIEWPKLAKEERTHDKEFVKKLALSIETEGLHQPVLVRPNPTKPGSYIGVFGWHRTAAFGLLKRNAIPAVIAVDMGDEEAGIATTSENMFRNPLNKAQHNLAVTKWYDFYERKRKEFDSAKQEQKDAAKKPTGRPKKVTPSDENPPVEVQTGPTEEVIALPPEPPKNFAAHVAAVTGQSETTVKRCLKVGKAFSPDQLEVFAQCGVNQTWMETIAAMPEAKRAGVVNLIASGAEPQEAIAKIDETPEVRRADGKTFEVVGSEGSEKSEDDMTDDEWVRFHCAETIALLYNPNVFIAHASLYRQFKDLRQTFKSKTKAALAEAKKDGLAGGYISAVSRVVNMSHPSHWLRCGGCSGQGFFGDGKCRDCTGNGFMLKFEGK